MSHRSIVARICLLMVAAAVVGSCGKISGVDKTTHAERGDKYAAEKKYKEAIIEYRGAIQQDPRFGEARYKLAEAYVQVNDLQNAFREYMRAADLLPASLEAQLKAGSFLLLAGQFEDAKTRAGKALAIDPKHIGTQILLGNAMAGLKDLDGAIAEIEEAVQLDPTQSRTYANLGALQLARGKTEEAEVAFKKAVEIDPKSLNAHLALANYYWSAGRQAEAEDSLRRAVSLDPGHLLANRALASFYMSANRAPEAEKYLKALAEGSKDPTFRLALADYYLLMNRAKDAVPILEGLASDKALFAAANMRIAAVEYADQRAAHGHQVLDDVLRRQPTYAPALLLKGRFLLAENKVDEALVKVKAATAADPKSAGAYYTLGALYARQNDLQGATQAFKDVLKLNPRAVAAELQLARLHLAKIGVKLTTLTKEQADYIGVPVEGPYKADHYRY